MTQQQHINPARPATPPAGPPTLLQVIRRLCATHALAFALVAVAIVLSACANPPRPPVHAPAGDYTFLRSYGRWLINQQMTEHNLTGLSIAVVDDRRILWTEGFGYADKARQIRASPKTVYRLGSVSKLLTAAAVMQLADRGLIDIDKPLATYLAGFSPKHRGSGQPVITIRHLLTHHSGLPRDHIAGMWGHEPAPFSTLLAQVQSRYLVAAPGQLYGYSNMGYSLLGLLVERVSGKPFAAQIQQSLLAPLGMNASYFASTLRPSNHAAKAYNEDDQRAAVPLRDLPAGGLNASANDMAAFMQMMLAEGAWREQQLLDRSTCNQMFRPQNGGVRRDLDFRVGLGWHLGPRIEDRPVAHHAGGTIWFRSKLLLLPEDKLGVVVLTNSMHKASVESIVATRMLSLALRAKRGVVGQEQARQSRRKELSRTSAKLTDSYLGWYATAMGPAQLVRRGTHYLVVLGDKKLRLVNKPGGYGLRYRLWGLFPMTPDRLEHLTIAFDTVAGQRLMLAVGGERRQPLGFAVMPRQIPSEWRRRIGEYHLANRNKDFRFFGDIRLHAPPEPGAGFLVAEVEVLEPVAAVMRMVVSPLSSTEALVDSGVFGHMRGETIRAVQRADQQCLAFSGYRFCRT